MNLSKNAIRLLLFLHNHNTDRFMLSELRQMPFFTNSARLSRFLKFAVQKKLIKRTDCCIKGRNYACYEIAGWANDFVSNLEIFAE